MKEAKYHEIAFKIAQRIANKELHVGDKLRGRSILSSEYKVSSETIRKAIRLLANRGVVDVKERSGIYVLSHMAAHDYIIMHSQKNRDQHLYEEIIGLMNEQKEINQQLTNKIKRFERLTEHSAHFPFDYFHVKLREESPYLGMAIKDIPFWEHTNGTIIAIEQSDKYQMSPNPATILNKNDVLYILGNENVYKKTLTFFNI